MNREKELRSDIRCSSEYMQLTKYLTQHSDAILGYAHKLTLHHDDALDLYQETVYRSLANLAHYKESGNTAAWIYTIMRNTFINNQRRNSYRATANIQDIEAMDNYCAPDDTYTISELYDAIKHLNSKEKTIITLYLQGYSYAEISQHLNMKEGTVKSSIHRAKLKLRKLLE